MNREELMKIVKTYYPQGVLLNDPNLSNHPTYKKLINVCLSCNNDQNQWKTFIAQLKKASSVEIKEFILLSDFNPSLIAVFLTSNYERPKPLTYEPLQLVLKMSVLAPVYMLYFDNFVSDWNKRIIRENPITEREKQIFDQVKNKIINFYDVYSQLDIAMAHYMLSDLGDISISNNRKPYLDECIFGLYLSIHPHNILVDKIQKINVE